MKYIYTVGFLLVTFAATSSLADLPDFDLPDLTVLDLQPIDLGGRQPHLRGETQAPHLRGYIEEPERSPCQESCDLNHRECFHRCTGNFGAHGFSVGGCVDGCFQDTFACQATCREQDAFKNDYFPDYSITSTSTHFPLP